MEKDSHLLGGSRFRIRDIISTRKRIYHLIDREARERRRRDRTTSHRIRYTYILYTYVACRNGVSRSLAKSRGGAGGDSRHCVRELGMEIRHSIRSRSSGSSQLRPDAELALYLISKIKDFISCLSGFLTATIFHFHPIIRDFAMRFNHVQSCVRCVKSLVRDDSTTESNLHPERTLSHLPTSSFEAKENFLLE